MLAALVFLLFRRRRRFDFDGNFDPDRVGGGGTLPHIDLAGADDVEPYTYNPAGAGAIGPGSQGPSSSATGSDEMRQHGNVPAFLAGGIAGAGVGAAATHRSMSPPTVSAPSHYSQSASQYAPSSSEHYPDYSAYSGGYAQPGAGYAPDFRQPSPGPSLAMTGSSSGGGYGAAAGAGVAGMMLPSSKEREATGRRGLQVANHGDVMQHEDGGRLDTTPEEEDPALNEVPPRYDQIPRDR